MQSESNRKNKIESNKSAGVKISWVLGFVLVVLIIALVVAHFNTKEQEQSESGTFKVKQPESRVELADKISQTKPALQLNNISYPLRAGLINRIYSDKLTTNQKAGLELSIELYNKDFKSHAFLEAAIVVENVVIENYRMLHDIEVGTNYSKVIGMAFKAKLISKEDKSRLHKINNQRNSKVHQAGTKFDDSVNEEYLDRCLVIINKFAKGFEIEGVMEEAMRDLI